MSLDSALERSAYREAGRAVMSYFAGYSCRHLAVTEVNSTCDFNDFDFGNDTPMINAVSRYKDNHSIYEDFPENIKTRCKDVSLKIIIIIMGAPDRKSVV